MLIRAAHDPRLLPIKLTEPGEEHAADRHIDADPQGVSSTDQRQQGVLQDVLRTATWKMEEQQGGTTVQRLEELRISDLPNIWPLWMNASRVLKEGL